VSRPKKLSSATQDQLASFNAKQKLEASKSNRRKQDNRTAIFAGAAAVVLAIVAQLAYFSFGPGSFEEAANELPPVENSATVPSPDISENRIWTGSIQVGDSELGLELDGAAAPQAVANFLSLAQSGFYQDVLCHRLVTDGIYVLQCGDPEGTGSGGPGYNFGPIENAPADDEYVTGSLAMARVGGNASSMGSQFFIVYQDSRIPSDGAGGYTVFGKISSGLELLTPIIEAGVQGGGSDGPPEIETRLGLIELR
jgi:peptidyl-prolyl cis-trans isomerase B (cyclophilin B)